MPSKKREKDAPRPDLGWKLLANVDRFLAEAPQEFGFKSRNDVVQLAVIEFLHRWSVAGLLRRMPRPQVCHECHEIVYLLPIAEPGGISFLLQGHTISCSKYQTAPNNEEMQRQIQTGDSIRWGEFLHARSGPSFYYAQDAGASRKGKRKRTRLT